MLCRSLVHLSRKSLNTVFGVWNKYPWREISWSRSRSVGLCHSSSAVVLPCKQTSINTAALIRSILFTTIIITIRTAFHLDFVLASFLEHIYRLHTTHDETALRHILPRHCDHNSGKFFNIALRKHGLTSILPVSRRRHTGANAQEAPMWISPE